MDLVAEAKLPIAFDDMRETLRAFVRYAREISLSEPLAGVNLSFHENGAARNRNIARSLPADARAFVLGPSLDMRKVISAGEFLEQTKKTAPSRTFIHAELTDFLSFDRACAVLDELAGALPPSGRGITMMIRISGVKLRQAPDNVHAEFHLNRFQTRTAQKSATIWIYCPAESRTDRAAKKIISGIGESLGLRFGKNWLQQANSDGAPDPDALFAAYKAFQSAFDVATAEIEERGLTVDSLPLLFPRSDAATKRFEDVKQGIRAQVDLVGHLKRFMREYRPQYVFEQADSECVIFRNKLAPQVDALLIFDRHHLHGIGKSFGLQFGVDYPGAADFGQPPILQLFREDFFTLYRKNWEQRAWAYGTEEELARLLSGCRELFSAALPLLEKRIVEALSPLPMKLPDLIPVFGSLTAREAFAQAIPIAKNWAEDIALISIGSNEHPGFGTLLGPSAGFDGRLLRPGFWSVVFHSPKRGANVMVTAPHTGAIRYATFKFPPMYLTLPSQPECPEKWIDSPMIAAAFGPVWKQHSENPEHRVVGTFYRLGARSQTQKEVIWEVHAMLAGAQRFDRRDIRATFDAESGRLINTQVDS